MYGPPGCGKTMLAKAVAHHTTGKTLHSAPASIMYTRLHHMQTWAHVLCQFIPFLTPAVESLHVVSLCLSAAFIRVVGSEFVQKYLGEGPRMVRDVFRLAKENAPAIIFIDEIDAIATKRFDAQTGGKRDRWIFLMWRRSWGNSDKM